jgi:N-acetylmuramoyl-L-alanine amidase
VLLICAACGSKATRSPRPTTGQNRVQAVSAQPVPARSIDPATFSPGACVAFSPTAPARNITVFLDAGHGGLDPGATGFTESGRAVTEAGQALLVELDTMAILRAAGFEVVASRTRRSTVLRLRSGDVSDGVLSIKGSHDDLLARDQCANDAHADVLVGIYFSGGSANEGGSVTAYDPVRPFAAQNLRLAKLLQANVLKAMNAQGWGIPDGKVKVDTGLGSAQDSSDIAYGHLVLLGPAKRGYILNPSRMPGALIEPLFMTDPFEASIAASRRGQQLIARALATAIEQYFDVSS